MNNDNQNQEKSQVKTDTKETTLAKAGVEYLSGRFETIGEIKKSFDKPKLDFIREVVAPDLTKDSELILFLTRAAHLQLDPLNREIFGYKIDGRLTIVVSRDGKRKVASRTNKLESCDTQAIYRMKVKDEQGHEKYVQCQPWEGGELWGAIANVKRLDRPKERIIIVPLSEYKPSYNSKAWLKPSTMIQKVAESQALTAEFPDLLEGVYDEAEIDSLKGEVINIAAPQLDNGSESADASQIATLKTLGADMERSYTKLEAVNEIMRLSSTKGGKKS